eukprot:3934158-Rhodomonas_salina.1
MSMLARGLRYPPTPFSATPYACGTKPGTDAVAKQVAKAGTDAVYVVRDPGSKDYYGAIHKADAYQHLLQLLQSSDDPMTLDSRGSRGSDDDDGAPQKLTCAVPHASPRAGVQPRIDDDHDDDDDDDDKDKDNDNETMTMRQ